MNCVTLLTPVSRSIASPGQRKAITLHYARPQRSTLFHKQAHRRKEIKSGKKREIKNEGQVELKHLCLEASGGGGLTNNSVSVC